MQQNESFHFVTTLLLSLCVVNAAAVENGFSEQIVFQLENICSILHFCYRVFLYILS